MSHMIEQINEGIDTSSTGRGNVMDIRDVHDIVLQVIQDSGDISAVTVKLEESCNGTNWADVSGGSLVGVGILNGMSITARYACYNVSVATGSPSTATIILQAK